MKFEFLNFAFAIILLKLATNLNETVEASVHENRPPKWIANKKNNEETSYKERSSKYAVYNFGGYAEFGLVESHEAAESVANGLSNETSKHRSAKKGADFEEINRDQFLKPIDAVVDNNGVFKEYQDKEEEIPIYDYEKDKLLRHKNENRSD